MAVTLGVNDLIDTGAEKILDSVSSRADISAAITSVETLSITSGLLAWHYEQLKKFADVLASQLEQVDPELIDRTVLESDQFKVMMLTIVEAVIKQDSELKRQAFASALINSITPPINKLRGKEALLRLLVQISEEEMLALNTLRQLEDRLAPDEHQNLSGIPVGDIVQQLQWDELDTVVACEGLLQLGLVLDNAGYRFDTTGQFRKVWKTTVIGSRLLEFCAEDALETYLDLEDARVALAEAREQGGSISLQAFKQELGLSS